MNSRPVQVAGPKAFKEAKAAAQERAEAACADTAAAVARATAAEEAKATAITHLAAATARATAAEEAKDAAEARTDAEAGATAAVQVDEPTNAGTTQTQTIAGIDWEPSFYFVPASVVIEWEGTTLPRLQELRMRNLLVKMAIPLAQAIRKKGVDDKLFVSHRWESVSLPDIDGVQLKAVQEYLKAHPEIKHVWYE